MLHFHTNGEDIGSSWGLMARIHDKLDINIICMEYPGYGLYTDNDPGITQKAQQKCEQIRLDAECVFKFVRD